MVALRICVLVCALREKFPNKSVFIKTVSITSTIIFIIILDSLRLHQISFSLKVKRSAIISNKHDIHELLHELSNDLAVRKLENFTKISKSDRMIA